MLVERGESFAKEKKARGIYVDTPTLNHRGRSFYEAVGYRYGYEMPRYYEDELGDGSRDHEYERWLPVHAPESKPAVSSAIGSQA